MPRTGQRESSKVKWARGHAGKGKGRDKRIFQRLSNEIVLDSNVLQSIANDIAKGSNPVNKDVIEGKGRDKRIFQRLSNEIVLDSNVLQSIANDIAKGSNPVNKDVIGEDVTRKLVDVGHQSSREAEIEKGKLDKLCNEVLAVLDTIMDKILTHAFEFCGDKAELEAFLENRQQAKASLLDAFIARRARLDALARSPSHAAGAPSTNSEAVRTAVGQQSGTQVRVVDVDAAKKKSRT
ncbi:hypothetical protein Tcan_15145 [Toxocara canis]|uniref:Uncharacterized protein n=1 Tax=Toxocara canis TaxID=6265 RepID=A0A0B2V9G1_TOXCA|nr:hypothetical protein Tcan_15145 [Toxocara canis]